MSYDEHDAWLDELALGDWPFKRWTIAYALALRDGFEYTRFTGIGRGVDALHYRLQDAFGFKKSESDLIEALQDAAAIVEDAVDHSQSEAYSTWLTHEVWLPVLNESKNGQDDPAEMLIDSLVLLDHDPDSAQRVCAALGLWLMGERWYSEQTGNRDRCEWALVQSALALAETELRRGEVEARTKQQRLVAKRNADAANQRHTSNRENKAKGRKIWDGAAWKVQADAERAIAEQCHITKEVAGRWVREFKRSRVHPAMQG